MQYEWYTEITNAIYNFLKSIQDMLYPTLPFGAIAYGIIFYTIFWIIILLFMRRRYKSSRKESYIPQ
jgi:hypothetical protein